MRHPGLENDAPCGYRPTKAEYRGYDAKGSVFYSYNREFRERDLKRIGREDPELALLVACVNTMGLFSNCSEIRIWRDFYAGTDEENRAARVRMPELVRAIESNPEAESIFRELYFSLVIPVAAAMDAGERNIARNVYLSAVMALAERWGKDNQS